MTKFPARIGGSLRAAAIGIARAEDSLKARIGVLRLSASARSSARRNKGYIYRDGPGSNRAEFLPTPRRPIASRHSLRATSIWYHQTAFHRRLLYLAGRTTLK